MLMIANNPYNSQKKEELKSEIYEKNLRHIHAIKSGLCEEDKTTKKTSQNSES